MVMVIKVENITGKDLQPGDLFSVVNEEWWGSVNSRDMDPAPVGEKVYIRTNAPCPEDQRDDELVRLTIHHDPDFDHSQYDLDDTKDPIAQQLSEASHTCSRGLSIPEGGACAACDEEAGLLEETNATSH